MITASAAIQMLPKTSDGTEIKIIDSIIKYIASQGLKYFVGPFETVIEGEFDSVMRIICECQKICISGGADSLMSYIKINYSPSGILSIDEKVSKYN